MRTFLYYSGHPRAFDTYHSTLDRVGDARFLGETPGRAQLMYQANLDIFLTTLAGLAHATALSRSAGITAKEFLPEVVQLFGAIPDMILSTAPKPQELASMQVNTPVRAAIMS